MFIFDLSDGWGWVALIAALVIGIYCIVQTIAPFWIFSAFGGFRGYYLLIIVAILSAAFLVVNAIPFWVSFNNDHARGVTSVELAEHLGFEAGRAYPLVLSSDERPNGGDEAGYFTTSDELAAVPVGDLQLAFRHDESVTPVDLPRFAVSYKESSVDQSTIAISLDGKIVDESVAYYEVEYGWCDLYFLNLWLQCDRQVVSREMVIGENAQLLDIGQVIERHQSGSLIVLSPEDYTSQE